ncbi:MAG: tRNA guanosine(34) transglycosylase Tgt [Candidatus Kerfeldbacteria bacterium]|nr:tRNA guanosine(34) transglycosylase Tgt [Candidatus Kerfeldbacteria bacterium]
MIKFKILKTSRHSAARLGVLQTPHGLVETPCLVPVATQATVKTLTGDEVLATGSRLLIANTYHLHLRPGEAVVKKAGGLHKFMNWPGGLMTDSGGFQVFSLGFGLDLGVSKIAQNKKPLVIGKRQPSRLKITPEGVEFRSHLDGRKLFIGPRESIRIQEKLGADIIFAFDECPPPSVDYKYIKESVARTHRWAKICLTSLRSTQALFGIVQGGRYQDLRTASARYLAALDFAGFGIGGEFGYGKAAMKRMLQLVNKALPPAKPRHLLGIGHVEDLWPIIKSGVDTFDCSVPTHYARHGLAFTSQGRINLRSAANLKSGRPLDKNCRCYVCQSYTLSYLNHLIRAQEITGLKLLTFHNLFYFNSLVARARLAIKQGRL